MGIVLLLAPSDIDGEEGDDGEIGGLEDWGD